MPNTTTLAPFVTADIVGHKELMAVLDALPKALTDKVLQETGKKALQPVVETARSIVETNSLDRGKLAKSIGVSTRLSKWQQRQMGRTGLVHVYAGPQGSGTAHLVEFGTGERHHKKGKYVGRVRPEPFMRPAWDANKGKVLQTYKTEIWSTLVVEVRRLRGLTQAGKIKVAARLLRR